MTRRWLARAAVLLLLGAGAVAGQRSPSGFITAPEWESYRAAFVTDEGRVVDTGNGGISHSEGQGYGMLLAVLADQPAAFDAIWAFTRTELQVRDDGLVAWRWDPAAAPHVTDLNNASDGDLLIAYALDLAGRTWGRPQHAAAARALAGAIGAELVVRDDGRTLLLPAADGFGADDRPDGPVVNLSYWVFEALPVMARLDPGTDWAGLEAEGLRLLESARFGPRALPPDWLSVAERPVRPARGFSAEHGYNAIRIPLYLIRAGIGARPLVERLGGGAPAIADLASGAAKPLADPGYRVLGALVACWLSGTRFPEELATFVPTDYYPSTLHLLALAEARREMPQCL
jgi:endoglucanase